MNLSFCLRTHDDLEQYFKVTRVYYGNKNFETSISVTIV